jgi:haloalkane dehalogenase
MRTVNSTEYPFKRNFKKISGQQLHYIDEGSGDPIVMVHGNPTWSYYFRNVVKEFSKNHRTIVPDHIGCGYSDKPSAAEYEYTLENRIKDLETLLKELKIEKNITLVVHDWGGMIGMGFATKHPEKIKRLVITNTGAFHLPTKKKLPFQIQMVRNTPLGPLLVQGLNAFSRGANKFCVTKKPMPKHIQQDYLAPYDSWKNREAVYQFVKNIPLTAKDQSFETVTKIENKLKEFINIPTLICWGAKDFVFDDHFLNVWKEVLPNAEVHRLSDAGHYVLEDSWDEIKPLMSHFIEQHPLNT